MNPTNPNTDTTSIAGELNRLRTEVAALRQLLERQTAQLQQLQAHQNQTNLRPRPGRIRNNPATSRRRMLARLAGLVAAGGTLAAGVSGAAPAQARLLAGGNPGAVVVRGGVSVNFDPLPAGQYGLVATPEPGLSLSTLPVSAFPGTIIAIGVYGFARSGTGREAYAVYGRSEGGTGVFGQSDTRSGVYAQSNSGNGVYALSASGNGVYAQSSTGTGAGGYSQTGNGVFGQSETGAGVSAASDSGAGMFGQSNTGPGVFGSSNSGVGLRGQSNTSYGIAASSNTNSGLYAQSDSGSGVRAESKSGTGLTTTSNTAYGLSAFSLSNSQLRLIPKENNLSGPPTTGLHLKGELWLDDNAGLFVCTAEGTPGVWQKVSTVPA